MEARAPESPSMKYYSTSTVDTSSPFRSVKEAVSIFGERLLPRETRSSPKPPSISLEKEISEETHSSPQNPSLPSENNKTSHSISEITEISEPKRFPSINIGKQISVEESCKTDQPIPSPQNIVHGNDLVMMLMVLKKLESDVEETKNELKLLKERESETEVALASLNAELHKNMSKIARAEAAEKLRASLEGGGSRDPMGTREGEIKARGDMVKNMDSPTLAKILSISDYEGYFGESKSYKAKNNNKAMKKKPIVPLVTDILPWKKRSSSPNHHLSASLFSSHVFF